MKKKLKKNYAIYLFKILIIVHSQWKYESLKKIKIKDFFLYL